MSQARAGKAAEQLQPGGVTVAVLSRDCRGTWAGAGGHAEATHRVGTDRVAADSGSARIPDGFGGLAGRMS